MNREQWLQESYRILRPEVLAVGLKLPDSLHLSVGFPSVRALSSKNQSIGECWQAKASSDGTPQVFISPLISDGARVLDILIHEMIHASGITGHRGDFKRPALALGLVGKMTATKAGPELQERLNAMVADLGAYPHPALSPTMKEKKQGTRLLKAECEECAVIIRVTRKVVECPGLPICACGGSFGLN